MLPAKNPMITTIMSVLVFEAIVFGLAIPGVIYVEQKPAGETALWCGLAMVLALAGAFTIRKPFGWILAWAAQAAGVLLGLLTPWMFFIGGLFALLFAACVILGRRIEAHRAGQAH